MPDTAANRAKWSEALRSGRFKQARRRLRKDDDSYCCLGVACEIFKEETGQGEWSNALGDWEFALGDARAVGELPDQVRNWLGLKTNSGRWDQLESRASLIYLNDSGADFERIADEIDANPALVGDPNA